MTAAVVNDDLLDDEIVQNPSPFYAMLREHYPSTGTSAGAAGS